MRTKKASKSERNRKNLMRTDAMSCKTLWSDRRRLVTKTFLTFSRTFKRRNLTQLFWKTFFFGFLQREISLSGEKTFSLATLKSIIYHIRSNQGIWADNRDWVNQSEHENCIIPGWEFNKRDYCLNCPDKCEDHFCHQSILFFQSKMITSLIVPRDLHLVPLFKSFANWFNNLEGITLFLITSQFPSSGIQALVKFWVSS